MGNVYLSRAMSMVLSMGLASNMMAAGIEVNNVASLVSAVETAQDGDVIYIAEGVYMFDSELDIKGKSISLVGTRNVILDGQKQTRVINVHAGANLSVENMTVRNGYVSDANNNKGAGIRVDGGSLTVTNCRFLDNNVDGIESNWTGGAGIHSCNATLTVTNSEFRGNSAYQGGAIILQNSDANITNTLFDGNKTVFAQGGKKDAAKGGAICVRTDDGNVHTHNFSYCVFKDNVAWGNGGAMSYNVSGGAAGQNTTYRGCSFVRNTTNIDVANPVYTPENDGLRGGAVFVDTDGKLKVYFYSCTIAQNYAGVGGGGVAIPTLKAKPESEARFINCTITGNHNLSNTGNGAGLWINEITGSKGVAIINTILTGNWSMKVREEKYEENPSSHWEYSDLSTTGTTLQDLITLDNTVVGYLNNAEKYVGDYNNLVVLRETMPWVDGETEESQLGELAAYDEAYFAYPFSISAMTWIDGELGNMELAAETYDCPTDQFGKKWAVNCIGAVQYDDLENNVEVPTFFDEKTIATGIASFKTDCKATTDVYYTLSGMRMTQPLTKGIYIHNGRKVVK